MSANPESRITINAPLSVVWAVLSDFETYPQWNPSVLFRGIPRQGASVPITLKLKGRSFPFSVFMEAIDHERELRWRGGPRRLMSGTHYFKVRALGPERTELIHGERFEGVAVGVVWPAMRGAFEAFYERINESLKARCEELA